MASHDPAASHPATGPQGHDTFQIQGLPLEVLMAIFDVVLLSLWHNPPQYDAQRTKLRLVCKRWDELILDTPRLWAVCSTYLSYQTNKASILRSRQHSLMIYATETTTKWWGLITPHLCRCRVLDISAFAGLNPLEQPLPLLLDLTIYNGDPGVNIFSHEMLQNMPLLQSFNIEGMSLPWCLPPPSKILHINLEGCEDLPLIVLVEMLHASPGLEVLRLNSVDFDLRQEQNGTLTSGPIYFENLHFLQLNEIERIPWSVILGAVRPAPSCNIRLEARYSQRYSQPTIKPQEIPKHIRDVFAEDFRNATNVNVRYERFAVDFTLFDRHSKSVFQGPPRETIDWISDMIESTGYSNKIEIFLPSKDVDVDLILRLVISPSSRVSVRRLEYGEHLSNLCSVREDGCWLLPSLISLTLESDTRIEEFCDVLEGRYTNNRHVLPLEELKILSGPVRSDIQARVSTFLKDCKVSWPKSK